MGESPVGEFAKRRRSLTTEWCGSLTPEYTTLECYRVCVVLRGRARKVRKR
jgi:hypothetical protein